MSQLAMVAAIDARGLTPTEKLVLIVLGNYANASAIAWPGIDTLAEVTGLGASTVRRTIGRLEQLGAVTINRRPGKGNRYLLNLRDAVDNLSPTPLVASTHPARSERTPARSERTPARSERRSFDLSLSSTSHLTPATSADDGGQLDAAPRDKASGE